MKEEEKAVEVINACKEKYPEEFLRIEYFRIKKGVIIPIGIFKCKICGKPILHNQFAFCGNCGSCDIGNKNEKWIIIKPIEDRVVDRL